MSKNYPTKKQWGPGPWQDEPDELEWVDEASGYKCRIKRALPTPGQLNGYVGVPATHPAYGLHYDGTTDAIGEAIEKIEVHGGLTYANGDNDVWWYGFDCAHAWDLCPGMIALIHRIHIDHGDTKAWEQQQALMKGLPYQGTYKTIDYVRKEVTDLARQLKALEVSIDVTSYTSDPSE